MYNINNIRKVLNSHNTNMISSVNREATAVLPINQLSKKNFNK